MEMAIPASDMMFDEIPIRRIGMNPSSTATGIVMIGTIADGMCQRNTRITRLTMTISRMSSWRSVAIDWSMSSERSYVVTNLTPAGRDGSSSFMRDLTRAMTSRAFSAWRMTTMPPTASPAPSRSAMPRRISGPSATDATSRSRTGVPRSSVFRTTCSRSAFDVT